MSPPQQQGYKQNIHLGSPMRDEPSNISTIGRDIENEGSLDIKCSIHPNEYIERICINPKYSKKRLLCWECAVDQSKELQRYRNDVIPITKYALQNINEYCSENKKPLPEHIDQAANKLNPIEKKYLMDTTQNVSVLK